MTNDEREALIEKAAKALYEANWGDDFTFEEDRDYWVEQAKAALAVFEQAHTPTDDEREALARLFDGHWVTLHGKCACGWVHPQYGSRSLDPIYVRQHLTDAVLDAGFRRPVQAEPTDATEEYFETLRKIDPSEGMARIIEQAKRDLAKRAAFQEGKHRG